MKGDINMNLCRCDKGHFYDKEKYATCPHCAGGSASDESLTTVFTQDVTASAGLSSGNDITEQFVQDTPLPVAGIPADQQTVSMEYASNMDTPTVPLQDIIASNGEVDHFVTDIPTEAVDDDDHTVGFFDDEFFSVPPKTVPIKPAVSPVAPVSNKVTTPCVGWMVALNGEHIGADFRLKVGKNFIGRNPRMDVALTEDKSVSRDRHAIVIYEPKAHLYLVQPGESSSLVYRNNEVVLSPVKLEAYDMITVGDINLLFMPLCGQRFNWSDLFEEMKK